MIVSFQGGGRYVGSGVGCGVGQQGQRAEYLVQIGIAEPPRPKQFSADGQAMVVDGGEQRQCGVAETCLNLRPGTARALPSDALALSLTPRQPGGPPSVYNLPTIGPATEVAADMGNEVGFSVSPEATGGAGTIDEYRIAAVNLVKVLRGDSVPGLPVPIAAIGLQRREAGNILDDVVLQASAERSALRIEYQVKRTLSPVRSDKAFIDSLKQCLQSMEDNSEEISSGRLRLGLATNPSSQVDQLRRLTDIAEQHLTLESFEAIVRPGITDNKVCERFDRVVESVAVAQRERGRLLETLDCRSLALSLLRCLQVWQFEVGIDGRDTIDALGRLADVLPHDGPAAVDVFAHLVGIAQEVGPKAGLIDQAMVRAMLMRRQVALTADPRQRAALARLVEASRRELEATTWTIADRLELPRESALASIRSAVGESPFVLVSGPAGVGKSVLARHVVKDLAATASIVVINLTGRGQETLADLQTELGAELAPALRAAATTGPRVLLVDGAEHALTANSRLLTAVLGTVPVDPDKAPPWTVVLTARTEAVTALGRHLPSTLAHIEVGSADDDEVSAIVASFPQLGPLTRHPRSERLLRLPYLVDLLLRAGAGLDERPLGEEDVMDHVWDHVVRRGEGGHPGRGTPHGRAAACLMLAEAALNSGNGSTLTSAEGEAVQGLISDDVLVRQRNRHRFAHDILLDYAVAIRLLDEDHQHLLTNVDAPRRFLRAVRLTMQRQLGDAQAEGPVAVRQQWSQTAELANHMEVEDGPRWRRVPYEALLAMSDPRPLLDALRPVLLANDGEQLQRLLMEVGRFAVTSVREPSVDGLQLDVVLAAPVVDFLSTLDHHLAWTTTFYAANVVQRWLLAAWRAGVPIDTHIADPPRLVRTTALWSSDDTHGNRLEAVLPALAMLGRYLTPEAQAVFDRVCDRAHRLSVIVEDPEVAAAAAAANPELLLLLAGRYYLDQNLTLDPGETPPTARRRPDPRSSLSLLVRRQRDDGVRGHVSAIGKPWHAGLAAPHYGPFEALLNAAPEHGLRLVGAVVDSATSARTAIEQSFGDDRDPLLTLTIRRPGWPEPISYQGTSAAWCWFRRTSVGPYPVMSALMALAEWALRQTHERPLDDVVDQVLGMSRSLAIPAVVISLIIARFDVLTDELDPFLEQPLVWDLENARHIHERMGLAYPLSGYVNVHREIQEVVLTLVVGSGGERREQLRALGHRLVELTRRALNDHLGHAPPDDHHELLVAQRRARSLDFQSFLVKPSPELEGMVEISVDHREEIDNRLEQHALRGRLNVRLGYIATQALKARDEQGEVDLAELWNYLQDTVHALDALGEPNHSAISSPCEAASAVASAVLQAVAHERGPVAPSLIDDAVTTLLDAVENPRVHDQERYSSDENSVWPTGADRSAAAALPLVLTTPALRGRYPQLNSRIEAAITTLAGAHPTEVRQLLAEAFAEVLSQPCSDKGTAHLHSFALTVLKKIVLNAGLGPWDNDRRERIELNEPLTAILSTGEDILDIAAAAVALPSLTRATFLTCTHGRDAATLMQTLTDYDILAWPKHYARHHYSDIETWRSGLDRYIALQALDGNSDLLHRYLDGFAAVGEDLRGLLIELADHAAAPEHGRLLLETYWPRILDRMLPNNRDLSGNDHREEPYSRDEDDLDRALLPQPPGNAQWPGQPLATVLRRWAKAFENQPHVADRAVECLARYGMLDSPAATDVILKILGDHIETIRREARNTVGWLYWIFTMCTEAGRDHKTQLRTLLDKLAEDGDTNAVDLQRYLESQ